jgi:hypothetical protein
MVFRVLRAATVWSDGSPMGPERQTENTKSHRPLFFHSSSAFPWSLAFLSACSAEASPRTWATRIKPRGDAERRSAARRAAGTLGIMVTTTEPAKRVTEALFWERHAVPQTVSSAHFVGLTGWSGWIPRVPRLRALHPWALFESPALRAGSFSGFASLQS